MQKSWLLLYRNAKENSTLQYDHKEKSMKVPFVIYADRIFTWKNGYMWRSFVKPWVNVKDGLLLFNCLDCKKLMRRNLTKIQPKGLKTSTNLVRKTLINFAWCYKRVFILINIWIHGNLKMKNMIYTCEAINYCKPMYLKVFATNAWKIWIWSAHFLSEPRLAWQVCLKKAKIILSTYTELLKMVEKRIRGGIYHAIYQYTKVNNKYMEEYNPNKDS